MKYICSLLLALVTSLTLPLDAMNTTQKPKKQMVISQHFLDLYNHLASEEYNIPKEVIVRVFKHYLSLNQISLNQYDFFPECGRMLFFTKKNNVAHVEAEIKEIYDLYGMDTCKKILQFCLDDVGVTINTLMDPTLSNQTLLNVAAYFGHTNIVKLVLEMSEDPYALACLICKINNIDQTALTNVIFYGNVGAAIEIMKTTCDIQQASDLINMSNALQATCLRNVDSIQEILQAFMNHKPGSDELNAVLNKYCQLAENDMDTHKLMKRAAICLCICQVMFYCAVIYGAIAWVIS